MAIIIECDGGCGARSPNAKGLHDANNWATVRVAGPGVDIDRAYEGHDKRYCEKCWPHIFAVQPETR